MDEIIKKLGNVKEALQEEKGGVLNFLGLIYRVDLEDKWDLILSASWIQENSNHKDLVFTIGKLQKEFGGDLDFLSKIIVMTPDEKFIEDIVLALTKEGDDIPGDFQSLKIRSSHVIKRLIVIALDSKGVNLDERHEVSERSAEISGTADF